jgi:Raf kinase inhibitor-like YbhB/YbcL family protein
MVRLLAALGLLAVLLSASTTVDAQAPKFRLSSQDIKRGAAIAEKFVFNTGGCTGANTSPALSWSGAPAGTKSFVLTVFDPDAPTGSGFWHWVMFNIPASVTSLPEGAGVPGKEPAGATQIENDYGTVGYGGPCPPKGDKPHRYIFTVFALKTDKLDLPATVHAAVVGFNVHYNTLAKAQIMARYGD